MIEQTDKERCLARGAYNWLRVSPLLTIPTLFIVTGMSLGWTICESLSLECSYGSQDTISLGIGVVVSALWHLILLQYVNDKESEFVRQHGRRALTHAGIRTGVAMTAVLLNLIIFSVGFSILLAVFILFILWLMASSWKNQIPAEISQATPKYSQPTHTSQTNQRERVVETNTEYLKRLHDDLQSEDDVVVLSAIDKLEGVEDIPDEILKQVILKELEFLAEDENMDIRMDARVLFNRLRGVTGSPNTATGNTTGGDTNNARELLNKVLSELKSDDDEVVSKAVETARGLEFSSEAVRRQLETLAAQNLSEEIRTNALAALDTAANRAVQKRVNSNRLDRGIRYTIIQEINEWAKSNLIESHIADMLRRRYDFDITPQIQPKPVPAQQTLSTPEADRAKAAPTGTATKAPAQSQAPVAPPQPAAPPEPRLSLLQTLTSESAIRIYLYLGAFFVIAAAAILGAVVPELRLPILVVGTLIFGGLAVLVKKRLPQPSFALFIVFSFLLPITANSLYQTLRESMNLSSTLGHGYWAVVYLLMAGIWSGSTRLYESRFFSFAAFVSLTLAFFSLGSALDAGIPARSLLMGVAVLAGLAGTWSLKKWKDVNFALPVFIAAHILQVAIFVVSFGDFGFKAFSSSSDKLPYLFTFGVWLIGAAVYVLSNVLFPFFAFPWIAAATLIPMPWFLAVSLDFDNLGSGILLFAWGAIIAVASEPLFKTERGKEYSLPVLIASIPSLTLAVMNGFLHETWLGLVIVLGIAAIFTGLHIQRKRWWLWTLALFNAVIAYFAFFQLDFMQSLDFFGGYRVTLLVLLFALPDLLLVKDWKANLAWRLPIRIYGAIFTIILTLGLLTEGKSLDVGICYAILAALFTIYALAYRKTWMGYFSAFYLAIAAVYFLDAIKVDAWLPVLSALALVYFIAGVFIRKKEGWASMLRFSGLGLGIIVSFVALLLSERYGGWYTLVLGSLFIAEMHIRKNGLFEIGAPILFTSGAYLILHEFKVDEIHFHLLAYSLIWVFTDLINHLTYRHPRELHLLLRGVGGLLAGFNALSLITATPGNAAICFGAYTLAYGIVALVYRKAWLVYIPAAALPPTVFFALDHFNVDAWLPALTGLAVAYFVVGLAVRAKEGWSLAFRNSALVLGSIVSIFALIQLKETGGWYALAIGLLFIAEMSLRKNGLFEPGAPILFTIGAFLILHDFKVERATYHLLAYSLIWLLADLLAHLAFPNPRPLKWLIRAAGGITALVNYFYLFGESDPVVAAIGFGVYSLLFLTLSLLYRNPNLLYAFTLTLPLFAAFLFRAFELTKWIHPVITVAALYYGAGYFLRKSQTAKGWESPLLNSGLGLGVVVSIAAALIGGVDASISVAVAATLWAVEAFAKRNAWLAFPANALYLLSYFIILFDLDVSEPQYYSIGAALFGLIQHYLLTRAESKSGAFIMGMVSQFILLGTTYIEMLNKNELNYFFLLFVQSLVILVYGIVIRSRSLTLFPIGFAALGVITVVYSALKDVGTIFVIGCTGVILLTLGVVAVLLRERIAKLGEQLSNWKA
jgi:hypothetical protein